MSTDIKYTIMVGYQVPLDFLYTEETQKNCKHTFKGRFCPDCGRKAGTHKVQAPTDSADLFEYDSCEVEGFGLGHGVILRQHERHGPIHTIIAGQVLSIVHHKGMGDHERAALPEIMSQDDVAKILDTWGILYTAGSYGVHTVMEAS